jgi:uncharacterized protein (TIGR00369 family)
MTIVKAKRTGLDVLREAAEAMELPPAPALLGWQALELKPGFVRVRYEAREAFYNPQGAVQGGFLAAMLDDAMGPAAFTLLDEGSFAPTLEMKVSFLRPARARALIAEGSVVHQSRRFMHVEGKLMTEDGELVATGTATLVVQSPQQQEDKR